MKFIFCYGVDVYLLIFNIMKRNIRLKLKENSILNIFFHSLFEYPSPINLSYNWNFGSMALVMLVLQIVTGIFLAMFYIPDVNLAFISVEYIMREVNFGYLLRFLHANGATMFFIVVYAHILRGLYYGSYLYPRHLLWIVGVIIKLLMIVTAFLGYVLPWGQMSFWGATVITNLVSVVPFIGDSLLWWLWGSFNVDHATLKKFFSLHFLLPFIIFALSFVHMIFLHKNGSNNILGIDTFPLVTVKLSPYYVIKDYLGLFFFFGLYFYLVFFNPDLAGHPDNYILANPMVTPSHIVPEWYFLPYFAILRSINNKTMGVLLLLFSIFILILVPYINKPVYRSSNLRPLYHYVFCFFVIIVFYLGYIGGCEAVEPYLTVGKIAMLLYFLIFLVFIPTVVVLERLIQLNFFKY